MAEANTDIDLGGEDDKTFATDAVHANRDIHSGLGVGARELAAQRDAHGAQATPQFPVADDDADDADGEEPS